MATLQLDDDTIAPLVTQIVTATIKALDLPAIAKAAMLEAVKQTATERKPTYSCQETAKILGITTQTLKKRRQAGAIKGKRVQGVKGYRFAAEEVEKLLGRPIG